VSDLADFLSGYSDRKLVLVAHCGAVTWALETAHALAARGRPGPCHLLASSWGRPDRGPYGPLGSIDLETADLAAQVMQQGAQEGTEVRPDVAAMAARVLRHDLQTQQAYRYDATRPLRCPVTVVAWTRDDVVPPQQVIGGWETCATASYQVLDGDHLAFLSCPPELQDVLTRCIAQSA
jgi:surfactin synthase thioesterase subunit